MVVANYIALAEAQLRSRRYGEAARLAALADATARKLQVASLIDEAKLRAAEMRQIQDEWGRMQPLALRLRENPDDEKANAVMGRFHCFLAGDWDAGLPLLARGSDTALQRLAREELAAPAKGSAWLALADGWWDQAEKMIGLNRREGRRHAVRWYTMAAGSFSGAVRTRVERRILDVTGQLISLKATYQASSQFRGMPALPTLLDGKGGAHNNDTIAFHTDAERRPFIVIDLGSPMRLTGMEIVNRADGPDMVARAATLAGWVSASPQGPWTLIWRAGKAEPQWRVEFPLAVQARYLKLGLESELEYLHLRSVKVYGTPGR
jgi:hypothetical protein